MAKEYKPCPFCGNPDPRPYVQPTDGSAERWGKKDIKKHEEQAVCCLFDVWSDHGCGATGGYALTRKEARRLWNNRA